MRRQPPPKSPKRNPRPPLTRAELIAYAYGRASAGRLVAPPLSAYAGDRPPATSNDTERRAFATLGPTGWRYWTRRGRTDPLGGWEGIS